MSNCIALPLRNVAVTLATAIAAVLCATPSFAVGPYVISPDGSEVTDQGTNLVWRRCSEGQVIDSTGTHCIGTAVNFVWRDALVQAQSAGGAWRLPNVKELWSMFDLGRHDPAIDTFFFPNTPTRGQYWSSTPFANQTECVCAWNIWSADGSVSRKGQTTTRGPVRLVRTGP